MISYAKHTAIPQDPARSHIEPDKFLTTNNSISLKTFFLRYSHNLQDCRNNQRRTPTSRLNPSQLKGLANCHQQLQSSPTGKYRQLVSHKLRNTYIGQTPQHPLVQHIGHTPQHPLVNLCNPVLHTTGLIIQYRHRVHAIATRIAGCDKPRSAYCLSRMHRESFSKMPPFEDRSSSAELHFYFLHVPCPLHNYTSKIPRSSRYRVRPEK